MKQILTETVDLFSDFEENIERFYVRHVYYKQVEKLGKLRHTSFIPVPSKEYGQFLVTKLKE